jgi:hypothetical protein
LANKVVAIDIIKRYISSGAYKPGTVFIGNKTWAVTDLSKDECELLASEIDTFVDWDTAPRIASMVVRAAPRILDAVRLVNAQTNQGYGGAAGRGQQLIAQPLQLFDLLRAAPSSTVVGTYPMLSWLVSKASTGAIAWSGTSTYNNTMVVDSLPYLAHIFIGFIDTIEVPKINKIQIVKDGDTYPVENPNFEWRGTFGDNMVPCHELLQPWIIPPASKYYIGVNWYAVGDDKLQPIGFAIKRATDVLSAII